MTTIELTDEQRQALRAEHGKPVDVVDPATRQRYVLLLQEQYERVRSLLERGEVPARREWAGIIPPGILRSQEAFWRDLPQMLKDKRNHGKWVCYQGDERIGIARTEAELIRECLRRGLRDDAYDLDVIEPRAIPPWEPEEIEPGGHEVNDGDNPNQPGNAGAPA
jgi:hypothetical protein